MARKGRRKMRAGEPYECFCKFVGSTDRALLAMRGGESKNTKAMWGQECGCGNKRSRWYGDIRLYNDYEGVGITRKEAIREFDQEMQKRAVKRR